jgi:hypothetical protein
MDVEALPWRISPAVHTLRRKRIMRTELIINSIVTAVLGMDLP